MCDNRKSKCIRANGIKNVIVRNTTAVQLTTYTTAVSWRTAAAVSGLWWECAQTKRFVIAVSVVVRIAQRIVYFFFKIIQYIM